MNDELKKMYLNSIALDAYQDYTKAIEDKRVVYERVIGNQEGFLYVKNNDNGYGVRISYCSDNNEILNKEILSCISKYLEEEKEEHFILINSRHTKLIEYFHTEGFIELFSSFNMEMNRSDYIESENSIVLTLYNDDHKEQYLEVLGEAFVPIRKQLNLKPYNWYQNNIESSIKGFNESRENKTLFGYFEDGLLLGVLEVIDNDLEMLSVRQSAQGNGIGSRLLQKGIEIVFSNPKYQTMTLGILKGNKKANTLYEKFGFEVIAQQTILKYK